MKRKLIVFMIFLLVLSGSGCGGLNPLFGRTEKQFINETINIPEIQTTKDKNNSKEEEKNRESETVELPIEESKQSMESEVVMESDTKEEAEPEVAETETSTEEDNSKMLAFIEGLNGKQWFNNTRVNNKNGVGISVSIENINSSSATIKYVLENEKLNYSDYVGAIQEGDTYVLTMDCEVLIEKDFVTLTSLMDVWDYHPQAGKQGPLFTMTLNNQEVEKAYTTFYKVDCEMLLWDIEPTKNEDFKGVVTCSDGTICALDYMSVAITSDNKMWVWGKDALSKIVNNPNKGNASGPIMVQEGVKKFRSNERNGINDGGLFLKTDNTLWAYGNYLKLFNSEVRNTDYACQVAENVKDMECNGECVAIIYTDGSLVVYEIPYDSSGKMHDSISNVAQVSIGEEHILVLKNDGTLWGIGKNKSQELKNDKKMYVTNKFIKIMDDVKYIEAGYKRSFAIKNDGSLWAWGDNTDGALGTGDIYNRSEPTMIMNNAAYVLSKRNTTYIIEEDGDFYICGAETGASQFSTIPVKYAEKIVAVSGNKHVMVINEKGELLAWGEDYGKEMKYLKNHTATNPKVWIDNMWAE